MADEVQAGGSDAATVTLGADATGFESTLDKAAASVNSWAGRVSARFDSLSQSISAKTDKLAGFIGGITEKVSQGLTAGEAVGGGIGGLLGSLIAPGVGTAIGAKIGAEIGKGIGENVDVGSALEGVGDFSTPIKDQLAEIRDAGAGLSFTFQRTWGEIKDLFKRAGNDDFFAGSLTDAGKKVEGYWTELGGKLQGLLEQTMARVADAIDSAVDRVKEPLAKVADWFQRLLKDVGLVDEGTQSWGDSIRSVQGVGLQVFTALARGFGYTETALAKAAGFVAKYLEYPFLKAAEEITLALKQVPNTISSVLKEIQDFVVGALQLVEEALPKGMDSFVRDAKEKVLKVDVSPKGVEQKLQAAADAMAKKANDALAKGQAALDEAWDKRANERAANLRGMLARGAEKNAFDDLMRELAREWDRALAEKLAQAPAGGPQSAGQAAQALVGGSREAVHAIIASDAALRAPPKDPQKQAAAGIDKLVGLAGDQLREARGLRDDVKAIPGVQVEAA